MANKNIKCSFCGKSQDSVERIIAGPGFTFAMNALKCVQTL